MEFIIIGIVVIVLLVILKFIYGYNVKELEKIAENKELDEVANNYPENIDMCKEYLKMLDNEKVKIEENKDNEASLYIAITDKISIANVRNSYTRIQTIAHECLHSIQDRKLLMFNFIFSNIYLLYFVAIIILDVFQVLPFKMMFLGILILLGFVQYSVRAYLENDAMIKARYLAKEYMEKKKLTTKQEIDNMVSEFDRINAFGIKCVNFNLLFNVLDKVLIGAIVFLVR